MEYRSEYIGMMQEWQASGEQPVPFVLRFDYGDFGKLIEQLIQLRDEPRQDEKKVNSSTFWLANGDNRLIGVVNIRHRLNEGLLHIGGHIGYGIRPSERRKGHATELLRLALIKAKQLGISKALLTCDKDNIGSAMTIMNNGGVLDSEAVVNDVAIQRYWIEVVSVES